MRKIRAQRAELWLRNYHAESGFKSRIDTFFPGRCLDKIRACHHAHERRLHYFLHRPALARSKNDLDVGAAARISHEPRLSEQN